MDVRSALCCVLLIASVRGRYTSTSSEEDPAQCFSKLFAFGVATAAYQIEGAWNVSGKGESIWDRYTHTHPDRVFDHTSGDVADDSYHLFKEDVALLADLGVKDIIHALYIFGPKIKSAGQ